MGDQFNVSSKRHEKHGGKMKVDGKVSQHIVIIVTQGKYKIHSCPKEIILIFSIMQYLSY